MSPEPAIEVRHLWKRFRAGQRGPLLTGRRAGPGGPGWRWALRDVSFTAGAGEAIGIVGPNGSGKSTLLKILARVMCPHAGSAAVTGTVGAMIEVQAGLHQELTGRENILLYGALLGWARRDAIRRLDEIVGFAGLDGAVDRQVKHYSTGMRMRLGFSLVALLRPDVLLVDEILAVGDGAFQERCLARLREAAAAGTTLVVVSHDLAALARTCGRVIWLDDGAVASDGNAAAVLRRYRRSLAGAGSPAPVPRGRPAGPGAPGS